MCIDLMLVLLFDRFISFDAFSPLIIFGRNPALDDEEWPEYSKENPIYRIFNAEGDGKHPKEHFGKGPMASACAFWNTYLPRLKTWTGMAIAIRTNRKNAMQWIVSIHFFPVYFHFLSTDAGSLPCTDSVQSRAATLTKHSELSLSIGLSLILIKLIRNHLTGI